jgi:type I restriction enzyme S subunit
MNNWKQYTLSDLTKDGGLLSDGDWVEKKDQDPNGNISLIQLADIKECRFERKSSKFLNEEQAQRLNCTYLEKDDLLIARMPDPLGRACLYPGTEGQAITAVDVCIVRLNGSTNPKWLMYWINAPQFRQEVNRLQTGTTRKRISKKNLSQINFPVPNLDEQGAISDKIETQFTRLDATVKVLRKIYEKLLRYKQSVLNKAFFEYGKEDTMGNVFQIIDYRGRTPPYSKDGILHIRTTNIRDGKIIHKKMKYVSEDTYKKYMTRGIPQKGDVLMTTEAPMGEAALIPDYKFSIAQRMVVLRPPESIIDKYVLYQIMSPLFQQKLKLGKTGTTVAGISSRNFKQVMFRLNDKDTQEKIVSEIESRFSVIDKIEEVVEKSLVKTERLRKSILKSAFEGKLVKEVVTA